MMRKDNDLPIWLLFLNSLHISIQPPQIERMISIMVIQAPVPYPCLMMEVLHGGRDIVGVFSRYMGPERAAEDRDARVDVNALLVEEVKASLELHVQQFLPVF